MLKPFAALLAALALAAPLHPQEPVDRPLDPDCPQGDLAVPRERGSVCIGRLTKDYAFSFVYPAEAAAIPALDAVLREEAARAETWLAEQASEARASGEAPGRMSYEAGWQMDALRPELAAASGTAGFYTGGAHGGIDYRTILIDRRRDRPIRLGDLFRIGAFEHDLFGDRPYGIRTVQAAFCRVLTAEVRSRRDELKAEVRCPDIEEQPVTLLCGARGRIEEMRVLMNPYVVGSWAEGPYEIDVPIDARMISAMKPRFRVAFGLRQETRARTPVRSCR